MATSCETAKIKARTLDETAQIIFDSSDYLGFAFVRQVEGAPRIQQQEVEFVVSLKGEPSVVRLAPLWVDGVGSEDGTIRWFYWKPEELHLVALVKTDQGAVTPTCLAANIASKPAPELYRSLMRLKRDRGS